METVTADAITEKLLPILQKHLKLTSEEQPFSMNTELADLGLDSMSAINVLLDVEATFNVRFPPSMLTEETFRTASTLRDTIQSLMEQSI